MTHFFGAFLGIVAQALAPREWYGYFRIHPVKFE